jgi:hypothetical protein
VLILKNKLFVDFHSRNMVILTKFLDFVMFGTRDLGHNGVKFKKMYHLHKPSYMSYLSCRKLQFNFALFIGPILTLRGPTSFFGLYACFNLKINALTFTKRQNTTCVRNNRISVYKY